MEYMLSPSAPTGGPMPPIGRTCSIGCLRYRNKDDYRRYPIIINGELCDKQLWNIEAGGLLRRAPIQLRRIEWSVRLAAGRLHWAELTRRSVLQITASVFGHAESRTRFVAIERVSSVKYRERASALLSAILHWNQRHNDCAPLC